MSMNHNTRDTSVRPAASEATQKSAPAKTIQHMEEMKMFAVEVGDENGVRRKVMAFRVGNQWYHDPAGEQWMARIRPIDKKGWLNQKLEDRFQDRNTKATAPSKDTVDILGAEVQDEFRP